jgi:thioredoxin-related protein
MKALLCGVLLIWMAVVSAAEPHGEYLGAQPSERPEWFKDSFLEFEEDIADAAAEGRRVMLYFHQDACPYCARLVEENFTHPEIEKYVRRHFDGISLNMWGDREVVTVAGKSFTEKTLAEALKVQFTPTLLFLDESGKIALRLNGYYPPEQFRRALQYAAMKKEREMTFSEFLRNADSEDAGNGLIAEDFFSQTSDLQVLLQESSRPLAVYFEAQKCTDCARLHQQVLTDPATRTLVKTMHNVLLDINSNESVVTPDGSRLSQKEFATRLNIQYVPTIVLFAPSGEEVHRVEGFFKTFHVQSSLAYVLGNGYREQPSFQRYISARGEKIREKGYAVDIYGYRSDHPPSLTALD